MALPSNDDMWREDISIEPGTDRHLDRPVDVEARLRAEGRLRPTAEPPGGSGRKKSGAPPQQNMEGLNVLWIFCDQLRGDTFGFAGHPSIKTPNLDRLAACGAVFERSYCTSPLCCPSRASMLTGQYLPRHGVTRNGRRMAAESEKLLLPRILAEAGYRTANIGKHHAGISANKVWEHNEYVDDAFGATKPSKVPFEPGYWPEDLTFVKEPCDNADRVLYGTYPAPYQVSKSHLLTTQAMRLLYWHRESRPLLLRVSYDDPHSPIVPPEPFASMYSPRDVPEELFEGGMQSIHTKTRTVRDNWRWKGWDAVSMDDHRRHAAYYMGMVSHIDFQIGRLLEYLEASGWAQNTLIVFNSDHGHMTGENAQVIKGGICYQGVCRIPTVMVWPGRIPPGRRVPGVINGTDLAPTILSACSLTAPEEMQGRNLMPLAEGRSERLREFTVSQWSTYIYTIIGERWKLIWYDSDGAGELYDLENDPYEIRNLWDAESERATRERLLRELNLWREAQGCAHVPGRAFESSTDG